MSEKKIKEVIARTFLELADGLETGSFGKNPVIGIAAEGSEHGSEVLGEAAALAAAKGIKTVLLQGEKTHEEMERMLREGTLDGAVTMHYPFPIGVSTVGKIVTPAKGKSLYLATTTGTADTDRVCAMVKNAVYGIIAAKADGVQDPSVGIANIDGARQCEKALRKLQAGGYPITFAQSQRADGGIVMRGNDLLSASADVMVMDSLTGNLMVKIFSAYTTGGSYESLGWGYGPGIGEGFDKVILIISRASGAPLICGAAEYASNLLKNDMLRIAANELAKAKDAGLAEILAEICGGRASGGRRKPGGGSFSAGRNAEGENLQSQKAEDVESGNPGTGETGGDADHGEAIRQKEASSNAVSAPEKEVVTAQIPGIEVMDLDDAVAALWAENIYAESGMGCTGPIIMISEGNQQKAMKILTEKKFV